MAPQPLPYCDGSRLCLPVKCLVYFTSGANGRQVGVVFTDNAEEKLTPGDYADPNWLIDLSSHNQLSVIALFKKAMEALGYKLELKNHTPTYVVFLLEPVNESADP